MHGGRARENMQNTNHTPEVGLIDLFAGKEDNGCQGRGCLRQELCMEAGRYPPYSCLTQHPAAASRVAGVSAAARP